MACKYKINGLELTKDEFLNYVKKQPLEESAKVLGITATPSAPFITDTNKYVQLGMRVALKEAVKQGADKIAWTTGEQQNERYDLSKQVDEIKWQNNENGTYNITPKKDGSVVGTRDMMANLTLKQVEDYVGKDIAEKIQNDEGKVWEGGNVKQGKLTGQQLKVGGKGMKAFYGSPTEGSLGIVGNVAKSLFKQEPKTIKINYSNAEVAKGKLDDFIANMKSKYNFPENGRYRVLIEKNGTEQEIETYKNLQQDYQNAEKTQSEIGKPSTQYSIDITPELKAEVGQGLPLFQKQLSDNNITPTTAGFVYDGDVYLNIDNMNLDTPIHEFGHLWLSWAKSNLAEAYARGLELAKSDEAEPYRQYVMETQPDLKVDSEAFLDEVLAQAIGDNGARLIEENSAETKSWLQELWDAIGKMLGISELVANGGYKTLTLNDYAKAVAVDLLKGKEIKTDQAAQNYFVRQADRLPLTLAVFNTSSFIELQGKQVNPVTVQQLLNQTGIKQVEKDLINRVIEENYAGQKRISYDELEATVRANIMPLERIFTSSYADYGMNRLGGDYGTYNTIILNAPLEHGFVGNHFSKDFRVSGRKNVKYVPKKLNDNTWIAVEESYETQANENNIYQFVGTAGSKEAVESWIEKYGEFKPLTKLPSNYVFITDNGKIGVVDENASSARSLTGLYETKEEATKEALDKINFDLQNQEENINKGMFGHIRVWQNRERDFNLREESSKFDNEMYQKYGGEWPDKLNAEEKAKALDFIKRKRSENQVFYVAELQSDYFQKNNARKNILEKREDYNKATETYNAKTKEITVEKDIYLKDQKNLDILSEIEKNPRVDVKAYKLPLLDGGFAEETLWLFVDGDPLLKSKYPVENYSEEMQRKGLLEERNSLLPLKEKLGEEFADNLQKFYDAKLQFFKDQQKKLDKEYNKQVEDIYKKLTPQEKQFIASQKEWEKRIVREAIKEASLSGATSLRFPTPYTLSVIEAYTSEAEGAMPYDIENAEDSTSLTTGDRIDYIGDYYTVLDSDGDTITIAPTKDVRSADIDQLLQEEIDFRVSETMDNELGFETQNAFYTKEEWDDLPNKYYLFDDIDLENIANEVEDGVYEIRESKVEDIVRDTFENEINNAEELLNDIGYGNIYTSGDTIYYTDYGVNTETLGQPNTYSQTSKEDFSISDLSSEQQTVARKYEEIAKILENERGAENVEIVTDENGFDWYETKLAPEEINAPVVAFQKQIEVPTEETTQIPDCV